MYKILRKVTSEQIPVPPQRTILNVGINFSLSMPKRGKDRSKPLPRGMEHMQGNVPLNGVRGWQRKKVAVPHADHWPYGALDFSQNSGGQYSSVPSNHVASSLSHEASLPAESTCTLWESPDGTPGADSQGRLRASSTSSTRVDGRVARPRRRGASCNRRIASSPTRISNTTRSSYPSFDAMDNPQSPHRYVTSPEGPYARTSDHSNHGSDIQSRYVFPPGMNADIVPCSSVPISTGAFESNYMTAYPSLFVFPDAERYSVGSSMSRYSASPNEIPSNLHVHQQVSTNSPVGEPHRDWQRAYDLRTRVDSQSSIAYAIPVGPTQQDTLNSKSSFRAAKHCYSSSQSSCASSTSSSLDSFLSTTAPYAPSECITHNMGLDAGLQVQQYSGDPDFQNLNSVINSEFSPYTLPNDMVVSGDLYHAAHQK